MAERGRGRVGSLIRDKYRIDAFLATGSMANVYAATHRNGSRVALKILHIEHANDPAMVERFRREGYFANTIGHPGVVRAIDDDLAEDGCLFLVMELLEGENLEDLRRRRGGKIPLGEILSIGDSVLDILAAAHGKDVLHRDLKPENVYVTKNGDVKLLDFGVARWNDGRSSSDMTAFGMVLGTPAFMPPEQALGRREDVDARSDLWAFGATLFTCITGEAVHIGGDAKTKLIATARTPARPIREVMPEVPRAVANVIDRALAFEKDKRWEDAQAMREALRWARLSQPLDEEVDRPTQDVFPPPIPTARRPNDDEPTLSVPNPSDVLTSAPPITLRDLPPSTEGPTFSLQNEPIFSLRRQPGDEPVPTTQRLPKPAAASPEAAAPRSEEVPISFPRETPSLSFGTSTLPLTASPRMPFASASAPPSGSVPAPPFSAPEAPGPLLSTIVPDRKKGRVLRVVLPILFGAVAGLAVYVVVQKQRHARANSAAEIVAPVASAPPAPPSPPVAASATAAPPPAPVAASALPVASAPPHKKPAKRKPKPAPAAAAAAATSEPLPTFTVPTPVDPPEPSPPAFEPPKD